MAVSLAVAFEVGAAASLASLVTLDKMNKSLVWALFLTLTGMQAMGNMYYAYVNLHDFSGWIELFGLIDQDAIMQKRILAAVSGAILPLVALGFIKSLVDYIKPEEIEEIEEEIEEVKEIETLMESHEENDEIKDEKTDKKPNQFWFEKKEDNKEINKPIQDESNTTEFIKDNIKQNNGNS